MKLKLVALGDLARIRTGKLDANASSPNGKYPFFTCAINPLRIDTYSYECECVLVAGNGDLNVKYHNGRFDAYQRTYIVEPISQSLDCRYLYHFLDSYLAELRKLSIGGVIKYIKLGNLTDAQIPLPPLEEQRRIAAILDKASKINTLIAEAIEKVEGMKNSLFDEMFVADGLHDNWEQVALGDLCDVQGGLQVSSKRSSLPIKVPYLRVANVLRGRLLLDEIKEIKCSQSELERTRLKPGDLLIVEGHGNPSEIGRVAMLTEHPGEIVHQNHLIRARSQNNSLDPNFLCFYLNSRTGRRHLLKKANTTSGLNTISTSVVKSSPIILPPTALQKQFCNAIKSITRLEANIINKQSLHQKLTTSLASELLKK